MMQSTMVYILAAFAIGFLFGMILETFIDTKTIREQTAENNELRVLNDKQGKEIVKLRYENEELGRLAATPKPHVVEVRDYRQTKDGEYFKTF